MVEVARKALGFPEVEVVGMAHLANLLEVLVAVVAVALGVEEVEGICQDYNGNCKNMEHREDTFPQL